MRNQVYNTLEVEYGTFNWLRREVGQKIGYNADHNLLGRIERSQVDSIIESALQHFIASAWLSVQQMQDDIPGEGRVQGESHTVDIQREAKRRPPHRWSFMQRYHTIQILPGESSYELPEDFGEWINEPTTTTAGNRISITQINYINQLMASEGSTGAPRYVALRKSTIGGVKKPTTELVFYPTPTEVDTFVVEYMAGTVVLDEVSQYPPGGSVHAETLLAYCYYVMAQRTGKGLQEASLYVQDRLSASIAIDKQSGKPTTDGVWVDDDGRFNLASLSRFIGRHLGAGPNPSAWTHQQEQLIAEACRRAQRKVFNPPLIRDERYPHDWSFLRPRAELVLQSGIYTYDLPANFAQAYGPMTHTNDYSALFPAIKYVGEEHLMQILNREQTSARPEKVAIRVKKAPADTSKGTRYEAIFWPVPDQTYQISYRYRINPDTQTLNSLPADPTVFDIPGGDRYWEVYMEAGLLAADELMDVRNSKHAERFYRAVESAVGQDRLTHSPDTMGLNSDPSSDMGNYMGDIHDWDANVVTYNGQSY